MMGEDTREKTNSIFSQSSENIEGLGKYSGISVTIMSEERIVDTVWIPISFIESVYINDNVYLQKYKNQWHAYTMGEVHFYLKNGELSSCVPLYNQNLYAYRVNDKFHVIYTEYTDEKTSVRHNYQVRYGDKITIGRSRENDIVFKNEAVSKSHAVLEYLGDKWRIMDCGSTNGVYVNKRRVKECELFLGDSVYIVGLSIIIGIDFISVNDENGHIIFPTGKLILKKEITEEVNKEGDIYHEMNEFFSRLPRKRRALAEKTIAIEAPPMSMNGNQIPLVLRMGSSMVMSGASAMAGNFMPLLTTLLFPTLANRYSEKERKEYEERRIEKYEAYLAEKADEIQKEKECEEEELTNKNPSQEVVLNYVNQRKHLWERRPVDSDYLQVRLGSGMLPLQAEIQYPKERFSMEEDELEIKMFQLAQKKVRLKNVPIVISLRENYVVGMKGAQDDIFGLMKRMIMQLAVLHSYDEVKFVILTDKKQLSEMPWICYLPHTWNDQKNMRFIATSQQEASQVMEYIKNQFGTKRTDLLKLKEGNPDGRPWYVVFATNKKLVDGSEFLTEIMQERSCEGMSIVAAYDMPPKDSTVLIHLSRDKGELQYLNQTEQEDAHFQMDMYNEKLAKQSMKSIGNIYLKELNDAFNLPQSISFLEMYKVGKIEQLQILKKWGESDPTISLAVPIGIGTDGTLVDLDLHEKIHGPHGLVAGTTGSGKSEILLTYILSMAIHFHPDEVAFVLIDYKGGGLAGAFVDPGRDIYLPHVVGTITNLDGAAIARSLISIQSELLRRQAVFNKAKSIADEGTMDIYSYQKLYRKGIVDEPMPHLFLISDEFAELKAQQPEFMDQIISIARIGRSLGIHLILATQKPAGIVTDQIRSNSKFKICMKVQDRSDSVDMLGRPDAIEIKETGRFYLQVGNNEIFLLGQSGWSGAAYNPKECATKNKNETIAFIDTVGQVYYRGKEKVKKDADEKSQLVSIVKAISDLATANGYKRKSLWKPMLEEKLQLDFDYECGTEKQIVLQLGMYDDPANQVQDVYQLNLTKSNHVLIVGETASGKTSLLQAMILQASTKYSPEKFQFYLFDYANGGYKAFAKLPHCGTIISEENEKDIERCFEVLEEIIHERKKLLKQLDVGNFEEANKVTDLPLVLFAIDDISGLIASAKGEAYYSNLQEYMKQCLNLGILFVLIAGQCNEVLMRIRQVIGTKIALHQKNKFEYGDVLECRCGYEPPEMPGRGLVLVNGEPLEFQAAIYEPNVSDKERRENLKFYILHIAKEYKGNISPKKLKTIPKDMTYEIFAHQFKKGRIPLGYSLLDAKPIALPMKQAKILSVYFGNPLGKCIITENILSIAIRENMELVVFKRRKDSIFDSESKQQVSEKLLSYAQIKETTEESLVCFGQELYKECDNRKKIISKYVKEAGIDLKQREGKTKRYRYVYENMPTVLIYFESFPEACLEADEATAEIYSGLAQRFANSYNLSFICGFDVDENIECLKSDLFLKFQPGKQALMFGGVYAKQMLADVPIDDSEDKLLPYNKCMMHYHKKFYALEMPCGALIEEIIDEDDKSIFD